MKLSDEQIEQCRINAKASWNRHRFSIRGQQITPADDYEWHFIYWIESTVRQDAEQVVRELVEALEYMLKWGHCPAADEKARTALTRAQQWLESGEPATCKWTCDADMDAWESACGEAWQFMDDGPAENNVRFCQGCGKPVEITPPAPTGGEN